jgi:hypothetical protein
MKCDAVLGFELCLQAWQPFYLDAAAGPPVIAVSTNIVRDSLHGHERVEHWLRRHSMRGDVVLEQRQLLWNPGFPGV